MSKYIGRLVNIGLAKESTRGTAVTAAYWLPKSTVAFFDRVQRYDSRLNYGSIGHGATAPKIKEWAEGDIEGDILDEPFGLLLLAALGTVTTTGPSDSAYTHTFSLQEDNQHDSLTITVADPDRTDEFSLSMLESLEIKVVTDDVVTFTASFKSKRGRQVASASVTYSQYKKFLGRHASVKLASLTGGLAAASTLTLKSFTIKFEKNTIMDDVLGTVGPNDILNTKFDISGEFELNLVDQTYRALMLDGSYRALRFQLTNTDETIGVGSTNPSFKIDLSRVYFDEWEAVRPNDAIVTQKINFKALWDVTNGNIINDCQLINGATSY